MIVTGTFELQRGPSIAEAFARHLEKEIEARRAAEEAIARSPLFNARFWSYIPQFRLESCSAIRPNSSPRVISARIIGTQRASLKNRASIRSSTPDNGLFS